MRLPIARSHLDGVVVFLTVAEFKGFREAARQLGVTPSAVSQSIRVLEDRLGAPLFSRSTRSVALTEAGERLLVHARPAVEMLTAGFEAVNGAGETLRGRLRINVPRASLALLANRLLPEFSDTYPEIELELFGEDRLIDIVEEGFDAGIRLGGLVQVDMVAVPLTPPVRFAVVGSATFMGRYGRPDHPRDLGQFRCVQLRRASGSTFDWDFLEDGHRLKVPVSGPLIVNDVEMYIRAALRGVGLAHLPISLVLNYIQQGELETVLDAYAVEGPGLTLYYPARSQALPKLRAFAKLARARLRRDFQPDDYLPTVAS